MVARKATAPAISEVRIMVTSQSVCSRPMRGKLLLVLVLLALVGCQREQPAYESRYTEPPATTVAQRPTFDVTSINTLMCGVLANDRRFERA